MFKIEKDKAFSVTLTFLRLLFILPKSSKDNIMFTLKYWTLSVLGFISCCALPLHHLITSIQEGLDVDISEDISLSIGALGALTTRHLFIRRRHDWLKLFVDVTDFDTFGVHSSFSKLTKRMNLLATAYFFYIAFGTLIYGTVAYTNTQNCRTINKEKGLHELCGSFAPIRLPFDANPLFMRIPVFLFQMIMFFCTVTPGATMSFMVYEATQVVTIHVMLLKKYFLEGFDASSSEERSRKLRICINYHNHVLRLVERLRFLVKLTNGHMSFISAIVFACIGNQILQTKPLAAFIYLMGYIIALFWVCHAGQIISDVTISINEAVYGSKWYDVDAKTMRNILLILMRSQKPCRLHGFPFGVLDYPLFLMIFKTSYSYLTLLNQNT